MILSILFNVIFPHIAIAGEKEIFDLIYGNYEYRFRPKQNDTDITIVTLTPTSFRLLGVNAPEQSIQFFLDFSQSWYDYRLKWERSTPSRNRSSIKIPESILWMPDIAAFSSLSRRSIIASNKRVSEVAYTGVVTKTDPLLVTNPCSMKVSRYPFDTQICKIEVGPWMYKSTELKLTLDQRIFYADDSRANIQSTNEWEVENITMEIKDSTTEGDDSDTMILTIVIRRNPNQYVYVVLVPTFVNCMLCIFGLFMPTDTTGVRFEKVTLGVACLLALSLLLGSATKNMPKADTIPSLGVYILATCLLCFFATATTSVLSFLHERCTTRGTHPPKWLATCMLCKQYDYNVRNRSTSIQAHTNSDSTIGNSLQYISSEIKSQLSNLRSQAQWTRIFDRIDVLAMIFFQTINILMFILMLTL